MTVNPSPVEANAPKPLKKGSLVRVNPDVYKDSLESLASDKSSPEYIFEGPGELIAIKNDYGQVRWRRPVPDVWLRLDQLQVWTEGS